MRITLFGCLTGVAAIAAAFALTQTPTNGQQPPDPTALHDSAIVFAGHEHVTNRAYT